MKAIRIVGNKGLASLVLERDVQRPEAQSGQLLIRVEAAGLNRADILQSLGQYPAPPGVPIDVPGLEYAGVVEAIGDDVAGFNLGDRVMGLVGGGAFAEYLVAEKSEILPIPGALSFAQAACIPEAFATAFDALVTQGGLVASDCVLIHAIGSGVGVAALQICRAWGALTLGTSRSETKLRSCVSEYGLNVPLLCSEVPAFAEAARTSTQGRGVSLVVDLVGGPYLTETFQAMETRGRIILVGLLGGSTVELNLRMLMQKRIHLTGTVMRSRSREEKASVTQAIIDHLIPMFQSKVLRPKLDSVFVFNQLSDAIQRMQSNRSFGKIVLTWPH